MDAVAAPNCELLGSCNLWECGGERCDEDGCSPDCLSEQEACAIDNECQAALRADYTRAADQPESPCGPAGQRCNAMRASGDIGAAFADCMQDPTPAAAAAAAPAPAAAGAASTAAGAAGLIVAAVANLA